MTILGMDHVLLAMPPDGEARARRFYGELLGLVEVARPEPLTSRAGCWFEGPGFAVHLGMQEDFVPAGWTHPAFVVADLAGMRDRLERAGVPVTPDHALPDVRRFYAADPFGNRIEFMQDGDGFRQHKR